MKKYFLTVMTLLALTAFVLMAADIDGKWTRQQAGRGGGEPTTQTLTLTSKGSALTGTLDAGGGRGGPVEISEGKVEGSNVSFKIVREGKQGKVEQTYKGTVSASELKLTVEGGFGGGGGKGGGPQEQTWTKAK